MYTRRGTRNVGIARITMLAAIQAVWLLSDKSWPGDIPGGGGIAGVKVGEDGEVILTKGRQDVCPETLTDGHTGQNVVVGESTGKHQR